MMLLKILVVVLALAVSYQYGKLVGRGEVLKMLDQDLDRLKVFLKRLKKEWENNASK